MPDVGSSRKTMPGLPRNAMATLSFRLWPPESSSALVLPFSPRPAQHSLGVQLRRRITSLLSQFMAEDPACPLSHTCRQWRSVPKMVQVDSTEQTGSVR